MIQKSVFKLEGSELVHLKHNTDGLLVSGAWLVGLYFHKTPEDIDALYMDIVRSFDIFKFSKWW